LDRARLDKVIELVNRLLAGSGFDCLEAEWQGNSKALTLYLDRDGGIDLAGCEQATRLLLDSPELDDMIPGSYNLEVSSPGVERPLRTAEHFQKFLGQVVQVKLLEKVDGRRVATGKVVSVSAGENIEVTMTTEQKSTWVFPLRLLQRANLVYEWGKR
jgi:ribosome maturation factor RimP